MNHEYIKQQIHDHGPTNVKDHYSISLTTLYKAFPPTGKIGNRGTARTKVPDDGLTLLERRNLFYKIVGLEMKSREDNLKQNQERKVKDKEFIENYKEKDIIAPVYNGPFKEFFNRF